MEASLRSVAAAVVALLSFSLWRVVGRPLHSFLLPPAFCELCGGCLRRRRSRARAAVRRASSPFTPPTPPSIPPPFSPSSSSSSMTSLRTPPRVPGPGLPAAEAEAGSARSVASPSSTSQYGGSAWRSRANTCTCCPAASSLLFHCASSSSSSSWSSSS